MDSSVKRREQMKLMKLWLVALSVVVVAAFGCKKEVETNTVDTAGTDTSMTDTSMTTTEIASGAEVPGTGGPGDINPITAETWVDDVTIGSELGPDGAMVVGKTGDDFAPGQKVNIAMAVDDAPANASVKVLWFGPGEKKIHEESKTVGGKKFLNFSHGTKGWAKGDYRAEIWVGDEKVNQQMFQVVDAGKAAM